MRQKRITILSGHYGSGKTNIAVNMAISLKEKIDKVAICDIDIVNPYFRTRDSEELLKEKGVRLICSPYANTNLDIPALPQEIYAVTDDKSTTFILDVGGDERGALALGRIAPKIVSENDYDMLFVVNFLRPLTTDVESAIEVLREIELASGIKFTGVINNTNLGKETTPDIVLSSISKAKELASVVGVEFLYTTVSKEISEQLKDSKEDIRILDLQKVSFKE